MILSMKNKYIVRSRISQKKFREILKYFTEDIEATKIANLPGISRISINKILKSIRILMSQDRLSKLEFRYSNSKDTKTFYHILLKMIRENPFNLS